MKKVLLIAAFTVFTLSACSNDDNTTPAAPVTMKVLSLSSGSAPGDPLQYFVEYGTSQDDKVRTEISVEVYNHYNTLWMSVPNPRWRGEVTE